MIKDVKSERRGAGVKGADGLERGQRDVEGNK